MADVTLWTLIQANLGQATVILAGLPIALGGASGWLVAWLKDRHLARYKSSLDQALQTRKADLDATIERLKAELGKEVEVNRFKLKKEEVVFNKRVEAAGAVASLYRTLNFRSHDEVMGMAPMLEVVRYCDEAADMLWTFRGTFSPFLSNEIRTGLSELCETSLALRAFVHHPDFYKRFRTFDDEYFGPFMDEVHRLETSITDLIAA